MIPLEFPIFVPVRFRFPIVVIDPRPDDRSNLKREKEKGKRGPICMYSQSLVVFYFTILRENGRGLISRILRQRGEVPVRRLPLSLLASFLLGKESKGSSFHLPLQAEPEGLSRS